MNPVRGRLIAAVVVLYLAWCGVQTWLAHRGYSQLAAFNRTEAVHLHALAVQHAQTTGGTVPPLPPVPALPASIWLRGGAESAVAMALVLALGTALVLGGRRGWALIVALIPVGVVAGGFEDGYTVGQAWTDTLTHYKTMLITGAVVDTLVVAAIVALLIRAFPREAAPNPAGSAVLRALIPALVLVGWWMIANPVDADNARQVWIAQAVVWVIALALIASSSLPIVGKLVTALIIAPYMSVTMLDDLIATPSAAFDGMRFVHHMLFAAAVTGYAAGIPWLLARSRPTTAPAEDSVVATDSVVTA